MSLKSAKSRAALVALATAAGADPAPQTPMATLLCRPALPTETATAQMLQSSSLLVCKPFAVTVHMNDGSLRTIGSVSVRPQAGPDFSNAVTPQQFNTAYNDWVLKTLRIDPTTLHSP